MIQISRLDPPVTGTKKDHTSRAGCTYVYLLLENKNGGRPPWYAPTRLRIIHCIHISSFAPIIQYKTSSRMHHPVTQDDAEPTKPQPWPETL